MKKIALLTFAFIVSSALLKGQVNEFLANGKPVLRIFSNYHTSLSGGETVNAFELKRVYIGYQHNFSEHLSGGALYDIGNPGAGKHEMSAYVKNAYLRYSKERLTVNFGMISTTQFKVQESAWGYRYLEKSFQDAYKFNSSADLGISVAYRFTDFLSADVIVQNGEGYKKIEADSTLRAGLGITLTPFEGLTLRGYYDYSNNMNQQQSVAGFLGYETDRFSIGAEYMMMLNYDFAANENRNGLSFFSTVNTSDRTKLFLRYDNLSSNTLSGQAEDWNLGSDGQLFIAGFEFAPVRGIKLAPNFKGWSPADGSDFISTFILNCEVKF